MTLAQMVVGMSLDPSGVTRGLGRAEAAFKASRQRIESLFSGIDLLPASALESQGRAAARAFQTQAAQIVSDAEKIGAEAAAALQQTSAAANLEPLRGGAQIIADMRAELAALRETGSSLDITRQIVAIEAQAEANTAAIRRFQTTSTASLSTIAADVRLVSADFNAGIASTEAYATALATAKQQALDLRAAGFQPTGEALRNFNFVMDQAADSLAQTGQRARASAQPLRSLGSNLTTLAAQSVGVSGPLGRIAQSLLLLGGGTGIALVAAVAVAAAGKAIQLFGEQAKKAREKTELLKREIERLREAARDPIKFATETQDTARAALRAANADVTTLRDSLASLDRAGAVGNAVFDRVLITNRLTAALAEQQQAQQDLGITAENTGRVAAETTRSQVEALSRIIGLGAASAGQMDNARREVVKLSAALKTASSSAEQIAIGENLATLSEALAAHLRRQEEAAAAPFRALEEIVKGATERISAMTARAEQFGGSSAALTASLATAADLLADIERRIDRAGGDRGASTGLVNLANQLRAALENAPDPFAPLVREAREAAEQMEATLAAGFSGPALDRAILRTRQQIAAMAVQIGLIGGFGGAPQQLIDIHVRLVGALIDPDPFRNLIKGGEEASARLEALLTLGIEGPIRTGAFDRLDLEIDALAESIQAMGGVGAAPLPLLQQFAQLRGLRKQLQIDAIEEAAKATAEVFDGLQSIVRGFGDAADALGLMTDGLDQMLRGTSNLIGAIQSLGQATNAFQQAGSLIGIAAAGAQILGGILGGNSELDRAQAEALRSNTESLTDLRLALEQFGSTIGNQVRVGEAALSISLDTEFLKRINEVQSGVILPGGHPVNAIEDRLNEMGLTFAQVNAIAEDLGITLIQDGFIVTEGFAALAAATGINIELMTRFGNSMDEQTRRLSIRDSLFGGGGEGALGDFQRQIEALGVVAEPLAARFRNLDLATQQGQDAARKALQELFTQFDSGFFTANADLLGGLSKDEFLAFLESGASALDELADASQDAVRGMLNIPNGFKLGAAKWFAELPRGAETGAGPILDPAPFPGTDLPTLPRAIDGLAEAFKEMADSEAGALMQLSAVPDALQGTLDQMRGTFEELNASTPSDLLSAIAGVRDAVVSTKSGGGTEGGPKAPSVQQSFAAGAIQILIDGAGKDATALTDEIWQKLKDKAIDQTGDSLNVGLVT